MLAALGGFIAAQTTSFMVWQRYSEPFVLILLALMASGLAPGEAGKREGRELGDGLPPIVRRGLPLVKIVGPVVLALMLGAVAATSIRRAEPAVQNEYDFLNPGEGQPELSVPTMQP